MLPLLLPRTVKHSTCYVNILSNNGNYGGRYWDRTSDPYDVKVASKAQTLVNQRVFAGIVEARTENGGRTK